MSHQYCLNWPQCTLGDNCKYIHPKTPQEEQDCLHYQDCVLEGSGSSKYKFTGALDDKKAYTLPPVYDDTPKEEEKSRLPQFEGTKKLSKYNYKDDAMDKKMIKRDMKAAKDRIKKALDVDVLIILDCTGSMGDYIKES